jgi:hypothetical protein
MTITLLSFLALAFFAEEFGDGSLGGAARARRRGADRTRQVDEAWAAFDMVMSVLGPDSKRDFFLKSFRSSWTFQIATNPKPSDAKLVEWDRMMEAGETPNIPPPGMSFQPMLERTESGYQWTDELVFDGIFSYPIANPLDASWSDTLFLLHFGPHTGIVAVWSRGDLAEAIEEAAEWAQNQGYVGYFFQPEFPVDEDGNSLPFEGNEEAYREAEEDLMYTDSGFISSDWGIVAEARKPSYSIDEKSVENATLWLAYMARSTLPDGGDRTEFFLKNAVRLAKLDLLPEGLGATATIVSMGSDFVEADIFDLDGRFATRVRLTVLPNGELQAPSQQTEEWASCWQGLLRIHSRLIDAEDEVIRAVAQAIARIELP